MNEHVVYDEDLLSAEPIKHNPQGGPLDPFQDIMEDDEEFFQQISIISDVQNDAFGSGAPYTSDFMDHEDGFFKGPVFTNFPLIGREENMATDSGKENKTPAIAPASSPAGKLGRLATRACKKKQWVAERFFEDSLDLSIYDAYEFPGRMTAGTFQPMRPATPKQPQALHNNQNFEVRKSAKFEIEEHMIGHGYKDALLKDYPLVDGSCIESLSLRHLLYDSDLGWSCIFAMLRLVYGCNLKDNNRIGVFLTESDRTVLEIEKDRFVKLVIRWLMDSKAAREIDMSTQDYVMQFHPVSAVPFPPPHAYPWSQCPTCVPLSKDGKKVGAGEEVVVERVPLPWAPPQITFDFEVRPAPASSIVEKCLKDEAKHAEEQLSKRLKKGGGSSETSAVDRPEVEEAEGTKNKVKANKVKKLKRRQKSGRSGVVCADFQCSVCKEPGPTVKSREGTQEDAAFCKKPECWRTVGDVSLLTGFHGQPLCLFCLQGFERDGKKTFVAARATFRQKKTNIPTCAGHYHGTGGARPYHFKNK